MKFVISFLTIIFCIIIPEQKASAQFRTSGAGKVDPKPSEQQSGKKNQKPKVQVDTTAIAPAVDNTFTYLILKSNKGSSVKVFINDAEQGKIRAGGFQKYPLESGEELTIFMDDEQGHVVQQDITVSEANHKKNIIIEFPDIDYAAIKRHNLDSVNAVNAAFTKHTKDSIDAVNAAIREAHLSTLTSLEGMLDKQVKDAVSVKQETDKLVADVKKGNHKFDNELIDTYNRFTGLKSDYFSQKKSYIDSAIAFNMKDKSDDFSRRIKPEEDNLQEKSGDYIRNVQEGKIPMSNNVEIAFRESRSSDLKFFILKDSINAPFLSGKKPLMYAFDMKSDTSVLKYLIDNGADVNYYNVRFSDNKIVYNTPFCYACTNSDISVVQYLIKSGAKFYPPAIPKKIKEENNKYFLKKIPFKQEVVEALIAAGYDMDDGTALILSVLSTIENNMVTVPKGEFTMGCTDASKNNDCLSKEYPANTVTVNDFMINKMEITQQQWAVIMEDTPSNHAGCAACPVEVITWNEVQTFITKLNKLSGKNYRLPSEAEWEYAARGGSAGIANNYKQSGSNNTDSIAWYKENSAAQTHEVGKKGANELGLFDMSGNVSEWCNDWFSEEYYAKKITDNPKGPEVGSVKVIRGGDYHNSAAYVRVSYRSGKAADYADPLIGFRLAADVPKQ
jgi:formylglycine-generating enzyme required for sulfatase activity